MGPLLGGFLNDLVHFQLTCDFMALTCMAYAGVLWWATRTTLKEKIKSTEAKKASGEEGVEMSFIMPSNEIQIRIGEETVTAGSKRRVL
jgi:hypothetical protein